MSVESHPQDHSHPRLLREDERALLRTLLSGMPNAHVAQLKVTSIRVVDLPDGGMGGIKFIAERQQPFGSALVVADYVDEDGVPVVITINSDKHGGLYEIDFWKVDFSPLRRYPRPDLLKVRQT